MDYDLTDYSFYLQAEQDAEYDALIREGAERAQDLANDQATESMLLDIEVQYMLEMI